jgi:hypothetical protein
MSFRLVCLSIAPLGGVWGEWWTVRRLSHAVEHFGNRLSILFLSLKDATVDSLGELAHLGGRGHVVTPLGVDLCDVGVRSGFDHADIIGTRSGDPRPNLDTLPTGTLVWYTNQPQHSQ